MTSAPREPRELFVWIFFVAIFLVAFVVVVGGIVCVKEETYTFAEYLSDLGEIYKLLFAAILSAIGHALVQREARRNGNSG